MSYELKTTDKTQNCIYHSETELQTLNTEPLLRVDSIKKYFPVKTGFGKPQKWLKAVDGISFEVKKDSVFAIVGESGCGKSTIARLVLKLIPLTAGKIFFKGKDISNFSGDTLKSFRRSIQIVFQDPFASLNPRIRIVDTLSEPFKIHKIIHRSDIKDRIVHLLEKVGLNADALNKYPHEFSGGQRQRICIARALTVSPELIVADEPLSALDVSIQAQILNLLQDIKKELGISLIFISHDLKVVHYLSDEVAVMYLGRIVEMAKTEDLFQSPKHPYTELLLASAPKIRVESNELRVMGKESKLKTLNSKLTVEGDVPSLIDISSGYMSGCPFHPRCPKRFDVCDKMVPELKNIDDRLVACHLY
jgi:oligopeptide/dipeptide ABC transporter ATP-binding protein